MTLFLSNRGPYQRSKLNHFCITLFQGWLLVKKHPEVGRRGKTISLDDLKADPIVMFQRRWYAPMVLLIWGLLPTLVPWYFWDEPLHECLLCCVFTRYVLSVNLTWLTNSWAHLYGSRPYDGRIAPTEVTVRHMLLGEGSTRLSKLFDKFFC